MTRLFVLGACLCVAALACVLSSIPGLWPLGAISVLVGSVLIAKSLA